MVIFRKWRIHCDNLEYFHTGIVEHEADPERETLFKQEIRKKTDIPDEENGI